MPAVANLLGMTFGRLTVVEKLGSNLAKQMTWRCLCACGNETKTISAQLIRGKAQSCGCWFKSRGLPLGFANAPTHESWAAMKDRCLNKNHQAYHRYGGRGITICNRWMIYENFLADMGERPPGTTLDRYPNNDGNYEPGNCRWATPKEQGRNTKSVKLEPHEPEQIRWLRSIGYTNIEVARFFGVSPSCISSITSGRNWRYDPEVA